MNPDGQPSWSPHLLFVFLALGLKAQGGGIDTVTHTGGLPWAVIEEMAQVRAAVFTHNLGARHEERTVLVQLYILSVDRVVEAGPAGTRIKLGVRGEQGLSAGNALVHTFGMIVVQGPRKSPFRALEATDFVLLGGQFLFPVRL